MLSIRLWKRRKRGDSPQNDAEGGLAEWTKATHC